MKVLLDESCDVQFRHSLAGHDVYTVRYMGWNSLRNGALIARAAADGFEVLVTTDRGIKHQQNFAKIPLAIAILYAKSNAFDDLDRLAPTLLAELAKPLTSKLIEIYP